MRPYKEYPADEKGGKKRRGSGVYHPFNWRGWQDFGTGALGDMACHTVNMPFRALKLGYPTSIEAKSTGINHETYPLSSQIHFEFPKREGLIPVSFTWYDGKPGAAETLRPGPDITEDIIALKKGTLPGSGCLLIGDKGRIFSDDDYGVRFYVRFSDEKELKPSQTTVDGAVVEHEAIRNIPKTIPRLEGNNYDLNQKKEWLEAIRTGKPSHPFSNFDIAAYLTEIILLGCIALRVGKKLDWDGPKMVAKNAPEAAKYVKREYRAGWKLA
jgi:predicted dehydrogenase